MIKIIFVFIKQKNFKVDIEINYSNLPDTYINLKNYEGTTLYKNYYKLGCTHDNELFFYAKNCIFILLINKKDYKIIQQFPFEGYSCPNLYLYENNIILSDYHNLKEFEKKENEYKLIKNYTAKHEDDYSDSLYKEKFEFNNSLIEINNWTRRQWIQIVEISKKNGPNSNNVVEGLTMFPGTFHKNQKILIEPSYLIIGDSELLIYFGEYTRKIDESFIQKAFFKNDNFYNFGGREHRISYENLSNLSFIYLSDNSFLSQINIIKNDKNKEDFDLKLIEKREDIKGSFFLRKEDVLFILFDNKIKIYHF